MKCFPQLLAISSILIPGVTALAEIRLPALFGDHMVLQQGKPLPVWGRGEAGETITVRYGPEEAIATVEENGRWKAILPALAAGRSGELHVSGTKSDNTLTFKDVVTGEVWIASGQSNMAWPVSKSQDADAEIAAANHPDIRIFSVPILGTGEPAEDVNAQWQICSPLSIPDFSAVAYFFGRDINKKLGVPVGLIQSAVGGSPAEAWTPTRQLAADPNLAGMLEARNVTTGLSDDEYQATVDGIESAWAEKVQTMLGQLQGPEPALFDADWSAEGWKEIKVPGEVDVQLGLETEGSFLVRLPFEVPAESAGESGILNLGPIDDFDETWLNGKRVGGIGLENPQAWRTAREYEVPAGLLRAGTNVLLVRVIDHFLAGGFSARPSQFFLQTESGLKIPLAGEAMARLESGIDTKPIIPKARWAGLPGAFFDGMIAPLAPFAIQGVIWYQGESNAGRAGQYQTLFPAMIHGWREAWDEEFPFYYVQLAGFGEVIPEPVESRWAELREAQTMTLSESNTGMVVAFDLGESKDIHPVNKQDVGARLAKVALAKTYEKKEPCSGPTYEAMQVEAGKIRLTFGNLEGGLVAKPIPDMYPVNVSKAEFAPLIRNSPDSELEGFMICGEDGTWSWANAKIEDDTVLVWSDQVPGPVAVRYAWADMPFGNLYNNAGLPAGPFETTAERQLVTPD